MVKGRCQSRIEEAMIYQRREGEKDPAESDRDPTVDYSAEFCRPFTAFCFNHASIKVAYA